MTIGRGTVILFIETYLFQFFYLFYVVIDGVKLCALGHSSPSVPVLSYALLLILLIIFNFLNSYSLFMRRNLKKAPEGWRDIVIPFISTYGTLLYNVIPFLPARHNVLVLPQAWLGWGVAVGLILFLTGLTVSILSLVALRRSFGIFIQVRDIVTKGLYRYVRHPMYLGYLFIDLGLLFIVPRLYVLVLVVFMMALRWYRAYLEEARLSAYSVEYREYMKKTPFMVPFVK